MKKNNLLIIFVSCLILTLSAGCKKLIEIDTPIDKVVGQAIYNSKSGATSVLTGIYSSMAEGSFAVGINSLGFRTGLSADELTLFGGHSDMLRTALYANSLSRENVGFWTELYGFIYRANASIEGVTASDALTEQNKKQLLGEARFLRAFFYFYLVNLYGEAPLLLSTNYEVNAIAARTSVEQVYAQIIEDLEFARLNLHQNYLEADLETQSVKRLRPSAATASALLSRVYLFTNQWEKAAENSKTLIDDSRFKLEDLSNVFKVQSEETIWSLQPVSQINFKTDARVYVLRSAPNSEQPVTISNSLLDAFEIFDMRRTTWVDSLIHEGSTYYYPYKYKDGEIDEEIREYITVFRLAEQYLIHAEAMLHLNDISAAVGDLNKLRMRASDPDAAPQERLPLLEDNLTADQVFAFLEHERQIELFSEWGHRWLDLKRTARVDDVMTTETPKKGGIWEPYKALYPIPIQDIQRNPSLRGNQNSNYPES
jgi:starch-binding outer membrane protein, SusD/RagB family